MRQKIPLKMKVSILDYFKIPCVRCFRNRFLFDEGIDIWNDDLSDVERFKALARMAKTCEFHHIVPVSEGGETIESNLIPLCISCHNEWHRFEGIIRFDRFVETIPASLAIILQMELKELLLLPYREIAGRTLNLYDSEIDEIIKKRDERMRHLSDTLVGRPGH